MVRRILWAAAFVAAAATVGCGGGGVVSVSGKVTLDGKPLEGASVSFTPTASDVGQSSGKTDAQGRYTLRTVIDDRAGAAVGKHKVSISLYKENPANPDMAGIELVPTKYNAKSELTFDVPAGGTDTADFDLKSK